MAGHSEFRHIMHRAGSVRRIEPIRIGGRLNEHVPVVELAVA